MNAADDPDLPAIEMIVDGAAHADRSEAPPPRPGVASLLLGLAAVAVLVLGGVVVSDSPDETSPSPEVTSTPASGATVGAEELPIDNALIESLPPALVAAEQFSAAPDATTARALLAAVGGIDALGLGTAEGAFDVVTFDPRDPDRLLASHRSSYGPADNRGRNEHWHVADGDVEQTLFAPALSHDSAHFNQDGSVAVWSNSLSTTAFGSRIVTFDANATMTSDPVYVSRSVIVGGTLFALTGSDDYYSTVTQFEALIADRGEGMHILDSGMEWEWIDSPQSDLVVVYPARPEGGTRVIDATFLETLDRHPLAGHAYKRLAVSGDGQVAVGVRFDGRMEVLDPATGEVGTAFGTADPDGIARPITLDHSGRVAITVDRDGTVLLWWVGHDQPIAMIAADAGPARVLSERRAPRTASAVEPAATRVAVQHRASGAQPTTWEIIDTDLDGWVERACAISRRTLSSDERQALGLHDHRPACR